MAYNKDIPNATDHQDVSQGQLKSNFQSLDYVSDGYVKFKENLLRPTIPTTSTGIYSHLYPITNTQEIFLKRLSVDAPNDIPLSASKMSNTAVASCDNGWSHVSGMLMKWGTVSVDADTGNLPVDVATICGGPDFARAFTVQTTPNVGTMSSAQIIAFGVKVHSFTSISSGNFRAVVHGAVAGQTTIRFLVIGV